MARLLFERAPAGFRTVRGAPIDTLQRALVRAGFDTRGVDGIFGKDTETALRAWQQARARPVTGTVDDDTWTALTGEAIPSLFLRVLGVTAAFEGHGFTLVVGNFDGAGITWGIIGFTLLEGELSQVLKEIRRDHPAVFSAAFGALEAEIVRVMNGSRATKLQFAESISRPPEKRGVREDWKAAFARLGSAPDVQAVQLRFAEDRWQKALVQVERFRLKTELGAGLCYDVIVQNGSFEPDERAAIERRVAAERPATGTRAAGDHGRGGGEGEPAGVRERRAAAQEHLRHRRRDGAPRPVPGARMGAGRGGDRAVGRARPGKPLRRGRAGVSVSRTEDAPDHRLPRSPTT